jgi:hypothetical protein
MSDFVCGANEAGYHLMGVNWGRDLREPDYVFDIRNVVEGDPSPDGKGRLSICRGIEVGHIFQLRTKYSEAMKATFLDESGQPRIMEMGCYGIGVTRIVGAAIEQNHDERGIIFPRAIAPFDVAIAPVGYGKSQSVRDAADKLYAELKAAGLDVLLDDRDERPGVMFADLELIGVPHRVTIGERGLKEGTVEYQERRDAAAVKVPLAEIGSFMRERLRRVKQGFILFALLLVAGSASAGAQKYEPLAASVQAALHCGGPDRRPPTVPFGVRSRRSTGWKRCRAAGQAHAQPGKPSGVPARGALRGHARRAGPATGARTDPGRKRLQEVRGVVSRAPAATCRSCLSGSS